MEKIKEIKSRYYIVLCIFTFILPMFFVLLDESGSLKEYIFYFVLFFPIALLLDQLGNFFYKRDLKFGVVFDHGGIRFNTRLGKELYIPWEELVIQKRISCSGIFTEFIFKNANNTIKSNSQIIYWANENSYIELAKKYLPRNHQLYKLVSVYAQGRGLKL